MTTRVQKRILVGGLGCLLLLLSTAPRYAPLLQGDISVHGHKRMVDISRVTIANQQTALGTEVEAIFVYVRDRIRYEPYRGVLRGGRGALLSEAANSADQAFLLMELLKSAGHEPRLARGTLTVSDARRLVESASNVPLTSAEPSVETSADSRDFLESIKADIVSQYTMITQVLVAGGFQIPAEPVVSQALLQEAATHYWVQLRQAGGWIDLDPSFADATMGQTHAAVEATMEEFPQDEFHRVITRILLEEKTGAGVQKRTLLTHESTAAALSGESLFLTHQKGNWNGPITSLASSLGEVLGALGAAPTQLKPVLIVGEDYEIGAEFGIQPPDKVIGGFAALTGVEFTALGEWIEFEFHAPGGNVSTVERTIFDRIGFAARQAGAGGARNEALGRRHPLRTFLALAFYTGPITNAAAFPSVPDETDTTESISANSDLSAEQIGNAMANINDAVSVLSDRLVFPLMIDDQPVIYSTPSPRLIIATLRTSAQSATLSIDLRRSDHRPTTSSAALSDKAFQLRLLRGVVDGVVETKIGALLSDPAASAPILGSYSTVALFREAAAQGIDPTLLRAGVNESVSSYPAEPAARMSAELGGGYSIVAPTAPVSLGGTARTAWWRIDERTGATVAVTEDGLHQNEYIVMQNEAGTFDVTLIYQGQQARILNNLTFSKMWALIENLGNSGWQAIRLLPFG